MLQLLQMINEITVNSSNAIDISRGELLNWVNDMLKLSLNKVEQLGTGAIFCQLLDVLYPGKVQLARVNWKAKHDYQFVNNFKVLQQGFSKLAIAKNVEIEKLIKCRYQDNLEFLQWFKKIFDNSGVTGKDYNAILRRGESEIVERKKEKDNKALVNSSLANVLPSKTVLNSTDNDISISEAFQFNANEDSQREICSEIKSSKFVSNPPNSPDISYSSDMQAWKDIIKEKVYKEERQFYVSKLKNIEKLLSEWKDQQSSQQLIIKLRQSFLSVPTIVEDESYLTIC